MNNIIANLRRDRPLSWENRLEAADEIVRLREENAQLCEEKRLSQETEWGLGEENVRLREETARLSKAILGDMPPKAAIRMMEEQHQEIIRLSAEIEQYKVDTNELCIENARLRSIIGEVLSLWGVYYWPEELYERVKAAIREASK